MSVPSSALWTAWPRVLVVVCVATLVLGTVGVAPSPASGNQSNESEESQPVAGYDPDAFNGFFIQDPLGAFRLNFGMYAQVRYNYNHRRDTADTIDANARGFSLSRARLWLEGIA